MVLFSKSDGFAAEKDVTGGTQTGVNGANYNGNEGGRGGTVVTINRLVIMGAIRGHHQHTQPGGN